MSSEPTSSFIDVCPQETIVQRIGEKEENSLTAVERKKAPLDENWILTSFVLVCITSIIIYIAFDYVLIENITAHIVASLLTLIGNPSYLTAWGAYWEQFAANPPSEFTFLNEAVSGTPGVVIVGESEGPFWIVKACTGMQAGAILLSLILFTKKKGSSFFNRKELLVKARVFVVFYIILFTANAVRIAFHLWLVTLGVPFVIAHDALSKPIGFVGTLIFAWVIERMGVPIIDTFADWMDYAWFRISSLLRHIGL